MRPRTLNENILSLAIRNLANAGRSITYFGIARQVSFLTGKTISNFYSRSCKRFIFSYCEQNNISLFVRERGRERYPEGGGDMLFNFDFEDFVNRLADRVIEEVEDRLKEKIVTEVLIEVKKMVEKLEKKNKPKAKVKEWEKETDDEIMNEFRKRQSRFVFRLLKTVLERLGTDADPTPSEFRWGWDIIVKNLQLPPTKFFFKKCIEFLGYFLQNESDNDDKYKNITAYLKRLRYALPKMFSSLDEFRNVKIRETQRILAIISERMSESSLDSESSSESPSESILAENKPSLEQNEKNEEKEKEEKNENENKNEMEIEIKIKTEESKEESKGYPEISQESQDGSQESISNVEIVDESQKSHPSQEISQEKQILPEIHDSLSEAENDNVSEVRRMWEEYKRSKSRSPYDTFVAYYKSHRSETLIQVLFPVYVTILKNFDKGKPLTDYEEHVWRFINDYSDVRDVLERKLREKREEDEKFENNENAKKLVEKIVNFFEEMKNRDYDKFITEMRNLVKVFPKHSAEVRRAIITFLQSHPELKREVFVGSGVD